MTKPTSKWSSIGVTIDQGVAQLTMTSPPVNAMSLRLTSEIHSALDELELSENWSVLHIASSLDVFSAGGDLSLMSTWLDGPNPGKQISEYAAGVQHLMDRIEALPCVTMAEIGGAALGGGLEMILATDVCIASNSAKLGLPEIAVGLLPAAGGTQRLAARCGRAMASRLILGAEIVSAEQAHQMGIVQWVVSPEELSRQATAIARRFASMPKLARRKIKDCLAAADDRNRRGFQLEIANIKNLGDSADARQLITAFLGGARQKSEQL
jgi:enoyl-CoA hydratase/carnithine racemase